MPRKTQAERMTEHESYSVENGVPTFTYSWARVKDEYRQILTGEKQPIGLTCQTHVPKWQEGSSFYGATSAEILDRLSNGYDLEPASGAPAPRTAAPLPDWSYNDTDGEYDEDLFQSGETDYYLDSEVQTIPQGVRLIVGQGFNAGTSAQMIGEYAVWIGSVIASLEQRGFSLEITLEYQGERRYVSIPGRVNHRIVVSRFGEINTGTDWSALFSPGAYRHLGWMTYCLPTEDGLATLQSGIGSSTPTRFGVKFDPETRTIRTTVAANSYEFPSEQMNREYQEALSAATGA